MEKKAMRAISTDSHMELPADLWTKRMSKSRWADLIPRVVTENGVDYWFIEGKRSSRRDYQTSSQTGVRFIDQKLLTLTGKREAVRPGAYDPVPRMKDLEADGVYGEVIFANSVGTRIQNPELRQAVHHCFTDWLQNEFCGAYPQRMKAPYPLDIHNVEDALVELQRAKRLGTPGVVMSVYPGEDRAYDHPMYDPFWAAAQELEMPVHFHTGSEFQKLPSSTLFRDEGGRNAAHLSARSNVIQVTLANMIMTGVFERFPRLKVVSVEYELSWAPYLIRNMDYIYTQKILRPQWYRFKNDAVPSDFFHQNVYISFQEDGIGVEMRHHIGVDNITWGSDYPHVESTFPRSKQILDKVLTGVPHEEREKIIWRNAAKLYNFGVPA